MGWGDKFGQCHIGVGRHTGFVKYWRGDILEGYILQANKLGGGGVTIWGGVKYWWADILE